MGAKTKSAERTLDEQLIATAAGLPLSVQLALLADGSYDLLLAENLDLHEDVWDALWARSKKSRLMSSLLTSRVLGGHQRQTILTSKPRSALITAMADYNELDRDDLLDLAGSTLPEALSEEVVYRFHRDDEVMAAVMAGIHPDHALAALAYASPAVVPDAAMLDALQALNDPESKVSHLHRPELFARIVGTRPHLFDTLVRTNQLHGLVNALATSQLATSHEHQALLLRLDPETLAESPEREARRWSSFFVEAALIDNPRTRPEILEWIRAHPTQHDAIGRVDTRVTTGPTVEGPYRQLSDDTTRAWILERSLYSLEGRSIGYRSHLFDLAELAHNPFLTEQEAESISYYLVAEHVINYLGTERAEAALAALIATHPSADPAGKQYYPYKRKFERKRSNPYGHVDVDVALALPLRDFIRRGWAIGYSLVTVLGDEPEAWAMFRGLLNDADPSMTTGELAKVASRLSRRPVSAA